MSDAVFRQKERLAQRAIICLCVLQPLLSVLSYWLITLQAGNDVTMALRILVLAAAAGLAGILSDKKRPWVVLCILGIVFYGLHLWAGLQAGSLQSMSDYTGDLANFVRVFQLPVMALALMTLLQCAGDDGRSLESGMLAVFVIIAVVELLSAVTGTNPYTYASKEIGLVGWFFFPNAQSAVLSMLFPVVLCTASKRFPLWGFCVVAIIGFLELYLFATRLTYLAIFVAAAFFILFQLVSHQVSWKQLLIVALCAGVCAVCFKISPMLKNRELLSANAELKQEKLDSLTEQGIAEFGLEGTEYLTYTYEYQLKNMVDRFGLEDVIAFYQGSTEIAVLGNDRTKKLNYCRMLRDRSPITTALFGISYPEMIWNGENFDVENDFHGILYLYGYTGLGLLVLFLLYYVFLVFRILLREPRRCFTPEMGAIAASLFCGLAHAYATAGVLRRPNASFYLSAGLAAVWLLQQPEETSNSLRERVCDE